MCEMFGISSKDNYQINDYLKEFYSHSVEHPHGWGLVCLEANEASIEKEPIQASKSQYLKERLTMPVEVTTAFAHIRYATVGHVEYRNCHPYSKKDASGRRWTLVHNGTIFDYAPLNQYFRSQFGDTDSERILLYIIDRINDAQTAADGDLTVEERFKILDRIFVDMSKGNKLNLLLYDGDLVYVHTNYASSLYKLEREAQVFFSTQPLGREKDAWQPVPFTTLMAYRQGEEAFCGTNHGNEYFVNEDDMKFLYGVFSSL